jgi:hypothetical protein
MDRAKDFTIKQSSRTTSDSMKLKMVEVQDMKLKMVEVQDMKLEFGIQYALFFG